MRGNQFITISAVVVAAASLSYAAGARKGAERYHKLVACAGHEHDLAVRAVEYLPQHHASGSSVQRSFRASILEGRRRPRPQLVVPSVGELPQQRRQLGPRLFHGASGVYIASSRRGWFVQQHNAEATVLIINASHNGTADVQWCTQFDPIPGQTGESTITRQPYLVIPGGDTVTLEPFTAAAEANQGSVSLTLSGNLYQKY